MVLRSESSAHAHHVRSLLVLLMAGCRWPWSPAVWPVCSWFVLGDERALNIVPSRIFPLMTNYQLSAIPLFIFMASMLERAGIINDMFDVIYKVLGGVKGGLAAATIIASTVLAAMVGVIGAAVVTMGIIALPAMLKRNYDPKIAMGSIMAGGTLGILIPRRSWRSSTRWWPSNRWASCSSARSFPACCCRGCTSPM